MKKIAYIKIQNFKVFGDEVSMHLEDISVLIGANNSGKTSVIQALALWSWAVKLWYEKKKNTQSEAQRNKGVALNRLEIAQVPIKETRYFWNNAGIRQGSNENISLIIKVGLYYKGSIKELGMTFTYHSPDLMYCQPTSAVFQDNGMDFIAYASQLPINLLYPMSGMSDKEFVFQEEAIRTQIGIGQTANVLRNICYHLFTKSKEDWKYLVDMMHRLFSIRLKDPFIRATGVLELLYNYENRQKTVKDLDITLAGRGQQQMLLVLAYLLSNKGSILTIDEPDAHLEILRQAQVFRLLQEVASQYDCQIIIVTHSEVVLNDAQSVLFVADGKVQEISDSSEYKYIKDALKNFGIEHYYKAKLNPHILYVEGSTDIAILRAFATKYHHPAKNILEDRLHYYYTQNNREKEDIHNEIDRTSGYFQSFTKHFQAIKKAVPELKAIAIFDGDNRNAQDESNEDFGEFYWKRHEIENYVITPKVVFSFVEDKILRLQGEIFLTESLAKFNQVFEKELLLPVFNNNAKAVEEFKQLPENMKEVQFENIAASKKVSTLMENVFREFAHENNIEMLLTKSKFYELVMFTDSLPEEVKKKLDVIKSYLQY